MKKWFVLLFYLFCSFQSNAKNYVLENNFDSKFVGKDLLFLEDENCNFNVNDINKATVKWESLTEKPFFFWKAEKCFWYKLSIFNATKVQKRLIIEINNFQIDSLDFYTLKNNQVIKKYFTGNERGYISRAIYDRNFLFETVIPGGQSRTLYFKTYPQAKLMSFPLTIWDANKKFEKSQRIEISKGILFGVIILFFLIAFYLSLILRMTNYFLYGLHVLTGTLYYFVQQGIAYEFFWMNSPKFQNLFSYILLNCFILTALIFIKQFFKKRGFKNIFLYLFDFFVIVYERLHDAEQEQTRSGMIMATQLAAATDFAIMSGSFDGLVPQVDAILAQPGTASVRVLDANNRLLFSKQHQLPKDEQQQHYTATVYQQTVNLDSNDWLVSDANNNTPKTILGVVDIGFSSAYILQKEKTIILKSVALALIVLLLVGGIGLWLAEATTAAPLRYGT